MRGLDVHDDLDHPVIDGDGHLLEFMPASFPYIRDSLTASQFDSYVQGSRALTAEMTGESLPERRKSRLPRGGWWASPTRNALDLATSMSPQLMHERLPELGFDYAILYPTYALGGAGIGDPDLRVRMCWGTNEYLAAVYGPYSDRYAVVGAIPMHTPDEAIAELEHCKRIGLKVVAIPPGVLRPIERRSNSVWLLPDQTHWWDYFGLDSQYDYDPVWRKFSELGFAVTVHWGVGGPLGASYPFISNWMGNHIGSFASVTEPIVKSLYLGGVTHRIPEAVFAFQECGVGFAVTMLSDTIEHWEKRNVTSLHEFYDPKLLDLDALECLMRKHSPEFADGMSVEDFRQVLLGTLMTGEAPEQLDEWVQMGIREKRDLVALFTPNFYFGCEADNRGVATAYAPSNPMGAELKVILGSDISHFDVPDFERVLVDAHSLVRENLINGEQFRKFTFENIAELLTRADPSFFERTAVGSQVRRRWGCDRRLPCAYPHILKRDAFVIGDRGEGIEMLFLTIISVDAPGLPADELWKVWSNGSEIAEKSSGPDGAVKAIYKVAGQRKVVVINEVSDHDDLDRIMMTAHLSQFMTIEQMLPLREYPDFAADLRSGWATVPRGVHV